MTKIRIPALVFVMTALILLTAIGNHTSRASNPAAPTSAGSPSLQIEPSNPEAASLPEGEACSTVRQGTAAGGNPCKDCPKNLAPGCTRVSCDPCCFRCPGEPFLRCL